MTGIEVPGIDPTNALQVVDAEPGSDEWHETRSGGLGGSDASAVVGLSRHRTPFEVWVDKVDRPDRDEDSEPAEWGRLLEPVIREKFAADHNYRVDVPGTLQSVRWPWMLSNLDGLVFSHAGDVVGGLEIKTRGFDRDDEWSGELVADHAELQAQHNMAVSGLPGFFVVAFLGGYGGFSMVVRWVPRDEELIADLVEIERAFWHDNVLAGVMPDVDHSEAAKRAITKRFPVADEDRLHVTGETAEQVWAARRQSEAAATYGEPYDEVRNRLRQLMGSHEEAYIALPDGGEAALATWKQAGQLDKKRLKAERPDVYEEYVRKVEGFDLDGLKSERPEIYHRYRGRTLLVKKEVQ